MAILQRLRAFTRAVPLPDLARPTEITRPLERPVRPFFQVSFRHEIDRLEIPGWRRRTLDGSAGVFERRFRSYFQGHRVHGRAEIMWLAGAEGVGRLQYLIGLGQDSPQGQSYLGRLGHLLKERGFRLSHQPRKHEYIERVDGVLADQLSDLWLRARTIDTLVSEGIESP